MRILNPDFSKPVQENFLGNNAVYHGYAGYTDRYGQTYTQEECEIEANRAKEMGLKIARTMYRWYSWDEENKCYDWNNKDISIFYDWCQRMKDRGIDIALQAGWNNPGCVWGNSWMGKSPFNVDGTWETAVKNYAEWVSESVHQLVEVRGFTNVKYLVFFTEPQNNCGGTDGGYSLQCFESWRDSIKAVHEQLIKDGRRDLVKLVGPNEGSTETSPMLKWCYDNADEYIDIYSSHNYLWSPNVRKCDVHSGKRALNISTPGGRPEQIVELKANTEYELSVYLKYDYKNKLNSTGYCIYGAFAYRDGDRNTIDSGGQKTNRLTKDSTKMLELAKMPNEYRKYSVSFKTTDACKAFVGVFYDGKDGFGILSVDDFCLTEKGSDENIIINPGFEDGENGWKYWVACDIVSDTYDNWQEWVKTARDYIKNNKPYWYDEYNVQYDDRYGDVSHGTLDAVAAISLMNAGCETSLVWTALDQQWPRSTSNNVDSFVNGDHRCGFIPKVSRSLVPYPSFYAFSLVTRYCGGGEGTKVYNGGCIDGLCCSLTIDKNGNKYILVANENPFDLDFEINLNELFEAKYNRHICDPKTIIPDENCKVIKSDKVIDAKKKITDSIPAYGVIVYTTEND